MKSIFIIEEKFDGGWFPSKSYDYDWFSTREEAESFIKYNIFQPNIRVSEYIRKETP
jgi:hypothetical protein